MERQYEQEKMEKVKAVEQEILDVFHQVCKKNHLKYSLAYGTLLGAVRHGGFIPWDDDIDVMMLRNDYEKLLTIWENTAPKGYLLQDYKKDLDYTNNFVKIRKDHTTFLQFENEGKKRYHKGIFIDVFPMDFIAPGKIGRKLQFAACAVNLLYTRGYAGGAGFLRKIENILLKVPKKSYPKIREKAERCVRKWNDKPEKTDFVFSPVTIQECKALYPVEMFEKMEPLKFNGKYYDAVKNFDRCLTLMYGNYMELPPEEERVWQHHPILIDFERNYEELKNE